MASLATYSRRFRSALKTSKTKKQTHEREDLHLAETPVVQPGTPQKKDFRPEPFGSPPNSQPGRSYGDIYVTGPGLTINGDVYNHGTLFDRHQQVEDIPKAGLCLGAVPQLSSGNFIGRLAEIEMMTEILQPQKACTNQRRVVLGGMGGVGKTQIAITYAERYQHIYDSIFWLNATSELTLQTSFRLLAGHYIGAQDLEELKDSQVLTRVLHWLSSTKNKNWLLIFDNHDEPEQLKISNYWPYAAHGSIIITTRLPGRIHSSCQQILVQPLGNVEESIEILATRSQRENVRNDPDARRLAERLDGLPLALATAGAYLCKSASISFGQYLQIYEERWQVDHQRPLQLQDYHTDQTLYTTWNLSLTRLEIDDPSAAHALKLLAYFDNQDIWYELLQSGLACASLPACFRNLCSEKVNFEGAMSTLVDYCLVQIQPQTRSYSIHNCVYDWTMAKLNNVIEPKLHWYVLRCIVAAINKNDVHSLAHLRYARLVRHAGRCAQPCFDQISLIESSTPAQLDDMIWLGRLLRKQTQYPAAYRMYRRALGRGEKLFGQEDPFTLRIVNDLGILYRRQGKLDEADRMHQRALSGREKSLGPSHLLTLDTVHNLGTVYQEQGKLTEAESYFRRALLGYEQRLGPNSPRTLTTINNLGNIYDGQHKPDEAEKMYQRALAGKEQTLGPSHPSTLDTVCNLGCLYSDQGKIDQAEPFFQRALVGYEQALGAEHRQVLAAKSGLARIYLQRNKLDEAEEIYQSLLITYEAKTDEDQKSLDRILSDMGCLYEKQGRMQESEQMYQRALDGHKKKLGIKDWRTQIVVNNLIAFYRQQGREEDADWLVGELAT